MYAITLDEEKYIQSYSEQFRTPGSIVVDSIPDEEDPEKMQCYQYIKKKYVFDAEKWAAIEAERAKAEAEAAEAERIAGIEQNISDLKNALTATDYQIIKCYEYAMNNLELPYDAKAMHEERQALRDQINALEKTL